MMRSGQLDGPQLKRKPLIWNDPSSLIPTLMSLFFFVRWLGSVWVSDETESERPKASLIDGHQADIRGLSLAAQIRLELAIPAGRSQVLTPSQRA